MSLYILNIIIQIIFFQRQILTKKTHLIKSRFSKWVLTIDKSFLFFYLIRKRRRMPATLAPNKRSAKRVFKER